MESSPIRIRNTRYPAGLWGCLLLLSAVIGATFAAAYIGFGIMRGDLIGLSGSQGRLRNVTRAQTVCLLAFFALSVGGTTAWMKCFGQQQTGSRLLQYGLVWLKWTAISILGASASIALAHVKAIEDVHRITRELVLKSVGG